MEKLSLRKNLTDDLLERWPKDAEGEPEEAVFLCNCIPCLRVYPGDGSFGRVVLGMSGLGTDIYVPVSKAEEAEALCNAELPEDIPEEE